MLQDAIKDNEIFPLRSLGGGFPEDSDKAELAYNQSYSVIDFLLRRGDASRMRSLLALLGEGATMDDGLSQLYGFNIDGLDAAWRDSVGAEKLTPEDLAATPTPTLVPTFPPLSFDPAAVRTPGRLGGLSVGPGEVIILACLCGLCLLPVLGIGAVVILGIVRGKK